MSKTRIAMAGLLVAAGLGLSACATDGYYGSAYGGYGDYYDYNGGYWDGGGSYYQPSYYGWYGDYYYPGSGVYVYDRNHNRHRWDDHQRSYWQHRRSDFHGQRPDRDNWDRFHHRPQPHATPNTPNGNWQNRGNWQNHGADRDRGTWQDRRANQNRGTNPNRGNWQNHGNWHGHSDGDHDGDRRH